MDKRVREFRAGRSRGRCPEARRALAVSYARERVAAGDGLAKIGRDLGSKPETLQRWMEEGPPSPFRAIEVVSRESDPAPRPERDPGVVLVTRQGHRVFGLSPAALTQLLTALG